MTQNDNPDASLETGHRQLHWFKGFRRQVALAWPLWIVLIVCVGLVFGGEPVRLALRYTRTGVAAGQWWRLFTASFVHTGWTHVSLDLAGVVLIWIISGREQYGWRWLLTTVAGGWAVGLGVWWAWPNVVWYLGISGVLHTYWAVGALLLIAARNWLGFPMLLLLAGKLAWEQASGGGLPTSTEILHEQVFVTSHLIGAIAGAVIGLSLIALDVWRQQRARAREGS